MVIFYGETWPTGHRFEREVVPVRKNILKVGLIRKFDGLSE